MYSAAPASGLLSLNGGSAHLGPEALDPGTPDPPGSAWPGACGSRRVSQPKAEGGEGGGVSSLLGRIRGWKPAPKLRQKFLARLPSPTHNTKSLARHSEVGRLWWCEDHQGNNQYYLKPKMHIF